MSMRLLHLISSPGLVTMILLIHRIGLNGESGRQSALVTEIPFLVQVHTDPSIVSYFTFIAPVASSILAPSLPDIGRDLNTRNESEQSLCLTIFVLGFASGPLLLAPLSEMYGRSVILQISNVVFLAFNTGCGFTTTGPQLIACRLFGGIGGSAPLAIGPAILADLFSPDERGTAAAIYSFIPIMGPALGPLCGGFIAEYSTWRWGFWATSILAIPIQFLAFFLLEETYAPVLLSRRRAQAMQEKCSSSPAPLVGLDRPSVLHELGEAMIRPIRMMFTQTIIVVMGLYQAYLYGLMYMILTTFPTLWRESYHQSVSIGGLNYISLGLGYCVGLQVCFSTVLIHRLTVSNASQVSGRLQDAIYRHLKQRCNGEGQPEFRIPLLLPVSLLVLPLGFLLYGWSAAHKLHWIVPNIGAFIFAAGIMMGFNALMTYVIDSMSSAQGCIVSTDAMQATRPTRQAQRRRRRSCVAWRRSSCRLVPRKCMRSLDGAGATRYWE
jgi:multidrug resistance protein